MPSYIAESYLPRTRRGDLSWLATRARDTARTLAGEGQAGTYLRSAFTGLRHRHERLTCSHHAGAGAVEAWGAELRGPGIMFSASGEGRVTT